MKYYPLFFTVLLLGPVSLPGQVNKYQKTEPKWQNIPKLVVPPGQTIQLKSNFLQIDTLIMHPNSGLSLEQGDNVLIVGHATFGPRIRITGRGKNGVNGRDGSNGEPTPRMPVARDGGRGGNGTSGGNAPNLKLYLGGINKGGSLSIILTGGNGGNGGNGGDGGTKTIPCLNKPTGTNGGNAGLRGYGGAGGELILMLDEGVNRQAIDYKAVPGKPGNIGKGGEAGLVIMKCLGRTIKTKPGNQGLMTIEHVPLGKTDTNPDFLEFPSPVPNPSALTTVPINISEGSSYSAVDAKLAAALKACGYKNLNYRKFKDGFAIFTGMEHITVDGVPLSEDDRFSQEQVKFYNDPSLIFFLKSLFTARSGYSRIIVFIVTAEGIGTKGGGVARSEAITWLQSGMKDLPSEIEARTFTGNHKVRALIYEFSKRENGSEPVFSEPSLISAEKHLKGASLWSILVAN